MKNYVDTTQTINHLSLCTGYEGIGTGIRRVLPNVREVAYVEIEAFAIANLVNKMEEGKLHPCPIYTNLKTFPYEEFCGQVDIMSFGFPCQPFSSAGKKRGVEDERHLFPYLAEGIRVMQPRIVLAENVLGILSCKTGEGEPVLQYVGRTLEEMGYTVAIGIFSASEVGLPHQRKRVFICGISNTEIERLRGWKSGDDCDQGWIQESSQEEQSNVWSEAQRCSRDNARKELGDTEHNGYIAAKGVRCNDEASNDYTKGKERTMQSEGASRSDVCTSIQGCEGDMGNTDCEGFQGLTERQDREGLYFRQTGQWLVSKSPSRPNEQQHQWEAPRVITKGVSESKLGGATDGLTSRVDSMLNRTDRLRLLGNGVVPAVAAKAFATLTSNILSEQI